jgi:hypothetical protein
MNHADLRSARALMAARREMARGAAGIHLDRDALSPRGWLSRRGRRLLDRPGHLLSRAGGWLERHTTLPGLPSHGTAGQSC